ncbi:hypothetical protein H4Q26_016894 [Puccinia striiformis f. sp. tritici PST-130]|uniref:RBR-type E3 ubiquitin transferase n=1 Tax=Puccinia striiformis f. sp. tritici PST-78 TaxID=1165861 RepID=A0A0L0VAT5_9BASI|nr:hypothetical protein Pst134EB_006116 [Puccinia striiformis f. sp. tritici]KAI9624324.1 hypothetical protein H4Q26_016894 [Puccinia striiformis f. sp. tritici PST-130]KNE96321.1 hypothetical protein PSTG_10440 [Puccinia striiformis f. sp. tritici PST-78]
MEAPTGQSSQDEERCLELHATELETLRSIYSSSAVRTLPSTTTTTISISIQIDLFEAFRISSEDDHSSSSQDSDQAERSMAELRFLPPFELVARLPSGYPVSEAPELKIDCEWARLMDIGRGEEEVGRIWIEGTTSNGQDGTIEGQECLAICVDWLEHDWLSSTSSPLLFRNHIPSESWDRFRAHNRRLMKLEFDNQDFVCPICLETRKGRQSIQLENCGHTFCRNCLQEFFGLMIQEGEVRKVRCCDEGCKQGVGISVEELESLVGKNQRIRYQELVQKLAFDTDPTLGLCPMESCQALVRPDPAFDGSRSEHLRVCNKCGYSFCFVCKKTWHGPTNKCSIPYLARIIEEYLSLVEDESSLKRIQIERKVGGKSKLQKLIDEYLEEKANQEWKLSHTTTCVTCFIPVEKIEGCNHMICTKCQTHFCFRCGLKLSPVQPYLHFSDPESGCFNQLMTLS